MNKDYWAMMLFALLSVLLLLLFVKKAQVREALFSHLLAQLFTWPFNLILTLFNILSSPVRLFPHATQANFLFAFMFSPSVFTIYYLHYPKQAALVRRIAYTALFSTLLVFTQLLASWYTNIIFFPKKWFLIILLLVAFAVFNVFRRYIDWFFDQSFALLGE